MERTRSQAAVVNHDELCSWLGLPAGCWPPNYYALLGLPPGETDRTRIEHQVHDRMFLLRCRQLCHPEQVTEAMNLLAKAFTCLTDPLAKTAYDAALLAGQPHVAAASAPEVKPTVESVSAEPTDPLAWLFGPWSASTTSTTSDLPGMTIVENWVSAPPPQRLPLEVAPAVPPGAPATPQPEGEPAAPEAKSPDLVTRAASSPSARQGLSTKRALYERLARTRELCRAWNGAGKFLSDPERRLSRAAEATELARLLTAVRRHLQDFPPLLGEAGQPGFYVVTLASQPRKAIVATFRMLLPSQREMLARDWRDGLTLLNAHRRFVREELVALRKTHWLGRSLRTVDMVLSDHPGWLLGAIVLVALAVATWLGLSH
jgi:hypothetical protein